MSTSLSYNSIGFGQKNEFKRYSIRLAFRIGSDGFGIAEMWQNCLEKQILKKKTRWKSKQTNWILCQDMFKNYQMLKPNQGSIENIAWRYFQYQLRINQPTLINE